MGPEYSLNYEGIYGVTTNIALKRLDISQMERLEELYGCHTGIEKLITRDASGKSALKKLRKVLLWNTKAKSIRLEDMPALEELELSGDYSKLNFTKCKKLHTIRLKSNKLKALDLRKNTMLKSLDIRGAKKVKKLNLSKNKILKSAMIQNMPISELNLSKNTFLYGLNFNAKSNEKADPAVLERTKNKHDKSPQEVQGRRAGPIPAKENDNEDPGEISACISVQKWI